MICIQDMLELGGDRMLVTLVMPRSAALTCLVWSSQERVLVSDLEQQDCSRAWNIPE